MQERKVRERKEQARQEFRAKQREDLEKRRRREEEMLQQKRGVRPERPKGKSLILDNLLSSRCGPGEESLTVFFRITISSTSPFSPVLCFPPLCGCVRLPQSTGHTGQRQVRQERLLNPKPLLVRDQNIPTRMTTTHSERCGAAARDHGLGRLVH